MTKCCCIVTRARQERKPQLPKAQAAPMKHEALRIRAATMEDLPAIKAIDRSSFGADDQYHDDFYAKVILDADWFAIVGEDEALRTRGWALLNRRTGRLHSIAVVSECRRRGFSEMLLRAVLDESELRVELLVDPENAAAIRLYRRLGFEFLRESAELAGKIVMCSAV